MGPGPVGHGAPDFRQTIQDVMKGVGPRCEGRAFWHAVGWSCHLRRIHRGSRAKSHPYAFFQTPPDDSLRRMHHAGWHVFNRFWN